MRNGLIISLVAVLVVFASLTVLAVLYRLLGEAFRRYGKKDGSAEAASNGKSDTETGGGTDIKTEETPLPEEPQGIHDRESYVITIGHGKPDFGLENARPHSPSGNAGTARPYSPATKTHQHSVPAESAPRIETAESAGRTETTESAGRTDTAKNVPAKTSASADTVTSPLPGTITEIRVSAGDTVKAGQIVAILSAMKMDNEIEAEYSGSVAAVNVNPGDNVREGSVILTLSR